MRFAPVALVSASFALCSISALAVNPHVHRGPTSPKLFKQRATSHPVSHPAMSGMNAERATQIQTALVKAGYLSEASGSWDATSEAAMQKLQGDNGWQTKYVPDARAIIKLGLGPNQSTPVGDVETSGLPAHTPETGSPTSVNQ